jgi:hypothetical protein
MFTVLLYDFLSLKNDVNVPVSRIRIRIRMFLRLPDQHPETLVRDMDPKIQIRIRTNMSGIPNTAVKPSLVLRINRIVY